MSAQGIIDMGRHALLLVLVIAGPPLIAGLVVGVLISIFQAVTQIQEFTLTFVPKIVVVFLVIAIFLPWMLQMFLSYATRLMIDIPELIQ